MDQNSLFNKDTRVFAFDDSPFTRKDEYTVLVGVIMRKDLYIETIVRKKIKIDGMDVTEKILEAVGEKGSGVRVILTQGITFGGFNVLDVNRLFEKTQIPIINVVDHEPDMKRIKNALQKYFEDWELRYSSLSADFKKFDLLYVQALGMEPSLAYKFVTQITTSGTIPEPLRIADLVAGICKSN